MTSFFYSLVETTFYSHRLKNKIAGPLHRHKKGRNYGGFTKSRALASLQRHEKQLKSYIMHQGRKGILLTNTENTRADELPRARGANDIFYNTCVILEVFWNS